MVTPIRLCDLAPSLGVSRGELISLVGGGGKTTALFALGRQLLGTTVLTTTTKMGAEQSSGYRALIDPSDDELRAELARSGRVLAWRATDERRAVGVSPNTCDSWFDLADNVVIEADGSRKRPFKAPAEHEPVIASRTTMLVACVGASAFFRPISQSCHRPELVATLASCTTSDELTPERAALVLLSDQGSRKGLPPNARYAIAICRVTADSRAGVDELVDTIGHRAQVVAIADGATSGA